MELSAVVFADCLLDLSKPDEYLKEFELYIYNLVYKTLGVKTPNYKQFIRSDLPNSRFMFLGKCLDLDSKAEIITELSKNLETLALNDKEVYGHAAKNLMFFSSFLVNAPKEVIDEKVLPQCQFIMNRSKKLTGIIADIIGQMSTYNINTDGALDQWINMLSNEQLMNVDQKSTVQTFLKNLHSICSETQKERLV